MVMEPKTIESILYLSHQYVFRLYHRLLECSKSHRDERASMLLEYLSVQEEQIAYTLEKFMAITDKEVLNTWFYEYTDRHSLAHSNPAQIEFSRMTSDEIQRTVGNIHLNLIDLFEHLSMRAETASVKNHALKVRQYLQSKTKKLNFEAGRVAAI